MKTVAIIGTFDTKGEEFAYVKNPLRRAGHQHHYHPLRRIRSANHA